MQLPVAGEIRAGSRLARHMEKMMFTPNDSKSRPIPEEESQVPKLLFTLTILLVGFSGGAATAEDMPRCMVDAPVENFSLIAGDFPPNDGWMMKQMVGRTLTYENGMTERFNKDGTYEVSMNGRTQTAQNYRLYSGSISGNAGGFVCIDFPDLKFQRYVVHKTELTLIDGFGERHVATIVDESLHSD